MKFLILMVIIFALGACTNEPNMDPRSLVPTECEYLDNIDDWQPVWCDEFDVDGLPDPTRWGYDVGGHGWGNRELQFYTQANLDNAFIKDGVLHLQAIKESLGSNDYTSARLVTRQRGDWLYGRIQIKAKMPSGRGLWPAIWMLPTNRIYGGWPYSGEIDIMEYVGYDPGIVHGTIHTGAFNHMRNTQIGFRTALPTVEEQFHLYEMIWEPGRIELFIDGERFAHFEFNPNASVGISNSDAWPFDDAFHLILNVAVGGTWGGLRGVDDDIFPQSMQVQYVRVFQRDYQALSKGTPSRVNAPIVLKSTHQSIQFKWDRIEDEFIAFYNIYMNDTFVGRTTVNAFTIEDLVPDTEYDIVIEAENFAGNRSPQVSLTASTLPIRNINLRIQAQAFDAMSGVIIERTQDSSGDLHVSSIDTGDTMEYILEVFKAGTYQITYRVSSETEGRIELLTRSRFPLVVTTIPATGGAQSWQDVTSESFNLNPGIYTFRLRAAVGGFKLNYFEFDRMEDK